MVSMLGYDGPPRPMLGTVLDVWRPDPLLIVVALVAAACYVVGVLRVARAGGRWPVARTAVFAGLGIPSLVVSSMGWPEAYGPVLFSVYAGQVMLLLLVVPFLISLGHPIALAKQALGPAGMARLDAVLDSRGARFFTVPVISPLLLAVIPFLIFFTPVYPLSLTHHLLLSAMHVALLAVGLAVLVPIWESDVLAARVPYLMVLLFAFIELLADAVPGIVIRLDTHVIAGGYFASLDRPWGPAPLGDQQLGGDLLWCLGEAIDLPFIVLLLLQWVRSDARDARRIDRALDAARPVPVRAHPADGGAAVADGMEQPWWETDATVFGDRADQYQRKPDAEPQ